MRPRVKAPKGWAFRIIIADRLGNYVFDDVNNPGGVVLMAEQLWREYCNKFDERKALEQASGELA